MNHTQIMQKIAHGLAGIVLSGEQKCSHEAQNGRGQPIERELSHPFCHALATPLVNGHMSSCFNISRGVKQGSVLFPTLFLHCDGPSPVMTLRKLDSMSEGGAIHAEDVHTTAVSSDSLSKQDVVLNSFASDSCLKVNTTKFEVIQISPNLL